MNWTDLKVGDKVDHFCLGEQVTGTITEVTVQGAMSEHKAVTWGKDTYTRTIISSPTGAQRKSHGNFAVPSATHKGERLTA